MKLKKKKMKQGYMFWLVFNLCEECKNEYVHERNGVNERVTYIWVVTRVGTSLKAMSQRVTLDSM